MPLKRYAQLSFMIVAFAAIGVGAIRGIRAATYVSSAEADASRLSGNATAVADVKASGGSAVRFGFDAAAAGQFQKLATFKSRLPPNASLVGPGATSSSSLVYYGYQTLGRPFDLTVTDPAKNYSTTTYSSPLATEFSVSALVSGDDNKVYVGTKSTVAAHIFRFDPVVRALTDIGEIPPDPKSGAKQIYFWGLTASPVDGRIYGCTCPSADIVSFNPKDKTPQLVNHGNIDAESQYGRYCAADPTHPYVYVATGSVNPKLIAFNITTKKSTVLQTRPGAGFARVFLAADNGVFGINGSDYFRLSNGVITKSTTYPNMMPVNFTRDGTGITMSRDNTKLLVRPPGGAVSEHDYSYGGSPIQLFRTGLGPDGNVYTGSVLPIYLARYSPQRPAAGLETVNYMGSGEIYSFLPHKGKLLIGAYAASATLMQYDPASPVSPDPYYAPKCDAAVQPNPRCIFYIDGLDPASGSGDSRLEAMTEAPDGSVFTGSVGHYGQLNGPLIQWNPAARTSQAYYPYANLGVSSLASATTCLGTDGCMVVGSTVTGGGGSTPTAGEARLYTWDIKNKRIASQFQIPGVTGVRNITSLVMSPKTGYIYGIANTSGGSSLFVYNPRNASFVGRTATLPFRFPVYNSAAIGSDGNIWGLYNAGIFTININTDFAQVVATSPRPITAGFALRPDPAGDRIYYGSEADLYSYTVKAAR